MDMNRCSQNTEKLNSDLLQRADNSFISDWYMTKPIKGISRLLCDFNTNFYIISSDHIQNHGMSKGW